MTMKKNIMILSMLVFFMTGMVAQAPAKDNKECTKTEAKACCEAQVKKDCNTAKLECDKTKQNCDQATKAACAEKKAACDKAEVKCCPDQAKLKKS